ncbi:MAG: hypothetical protein Q8936_05335 [Bacillota bacterium]|nr:hypothetical protein [Bacillota bacterium]
MFEDVYETVLNGSNHVYLDVPKELYFQDNDDIDKESVQNFAANYFKMTGRDGIPKVISVDTDADQQLIRLAIEVDMEREHKLDQYNVPDSLNVYRK